MNIDHFKGQKKMTKFTCMIIGNIHKNTNHNYDIVVVVVEIVKVSIFSNVLTNEMNVD